MFATVTYPYRDRETYEIHRTGDTVAYVGLVFFAEDIDFIVKGTIAATA